MANKARQLSRVAPQWSTMPVEMALSIVPRLQSLRDIAAFNQVCRHWWSISQNKLIWLTLSCHHWTPLQRHPDYAVPLQRTHFSPAPSSPSPSF